MDDTPGLTADLGVSHCIIHTHIHIICESCPRRIIPRSRELTGGLVSSLVSSIRQIIVWRDGALFPGSAGAVTMEAEIKAVVDVRV